MKKWLSTAVTLTMLGGCAAAGVKVSEEQATAFRVGKSTYEDVVAGLGQPTSTTLTSQGTRIAVYSYATASARPQNFIPYVGAFVGGYDTSASAVTFTFDAHGILASTSSTQSGMGVGANLAAGTSGPPSTQQPR